MKKKYISLGLILILLLVGCSHGDGRTDNGTYETEAVSVSEVSEVSEASVTTEVSDTDEVIENVDGDMFTDRDYEVGYDENESAIILLNGDSAACDSDAVEISGSTVTITDEGTYILKGTLNDGMVIVNAGENDKLQLVFSEVSINSETSAALYILEADKVFVTLAAGTENTISNGGAFNDIDDNNVDGTVFSRQDVTFNGSGSLTIHSPAGHGIVCKDDLVFTSGTYIVDATSHGLDANDSIRAANAVFTIDSGKDGMHAENSDDEDKGFIYIESGTFTISSAGDGISAGAYMQIADGSFDIVTGDDSSSMKGLKAAGDLSISNGNFSIDAADDAVHSNSILTVQGGSFEIASGDDAFHADDTLKVTSGNINITECYEGLEALHVNISGGDITLTASDDGLNAAGGKDESGFGGRHGNDQFGRGDEKFGKGDEKPGGDDAEFAIDDERPGGDDKKFSEDDGKFGGNAQGGPNASSDGTITISGGTISITASGDGIDANGTLEITGGYIVVAGPTQGDTSTLDYDISAVITGGTFIGTGASGMAQTFSDSQQGVITIIGDRQSAETEITLADSSGNMILTHIPELSYEVVIVSSPDIVKGETYTVTIGGTSREYTAS